jgi:ankyrin repeat protein
MRFFREGPRKGLASAAAAPPSFGSRLCSFLSCLRPSSAAAPPPAASVFRKLALDDVLQYVALAGYVHDAACAFGLCKDFWLNDVQLRWALKDARHGEDKMTRLMWACERGYLPRVRELLAWESDLHAVDADGWTPLHFASASGHLAVVRELVGRGAKLEAKAKNGNTSLHYASIHGRLDVVRFLLDVGADIEAKSIDGCTPLYLSSQEGKLEVVRELLARCADVNARHNNGGTALMTASQQGHAAVVRELLARGADVSASSIRGRTALYAASFSGRCEVLRELLKRDGVDANAQSNDGCTPLMAACGDGHLAAATLLIDSGANLALLSNHGWSALRCAEQRVAQDAEPPEEDEEPPTAAQRKEHRNLVALLKARGAT